MTVAVYTACFGGYDDLPDHPEIPGVDFVAYTDREVPSDQWEVRITPPDGHPRDQAKRYKLRPHQYLPDHSHTVWVDSSHQILTPDFVGHCLAAIGDTGIALYEHPWRDCIYAEADASLELKKYQGLPIREQVDSYRGEHPARWGLYATGTLARANMPAVATLMEAWAAEIDQWTYQDQLSLPVVCRRAGIRPQVFPCHQVFGNQWHRIVPHHRDD